MRWAVHVARMGTGELHKGIWWGELTKTNRLEERDLMGG